MYKFGFVLEQTLGHVAHGLNIERALSRVTQLRSSHPVARRTHLAHASARPNRRTGGTRSLGVRIGMRYGVYACDLADSLTSAGSVNLTALSHFRW